MSSKSTSRTWSALNDDVVTGGGHGGDREVTINVKRGVEAKNYADVRRIIVFSVFC